MIRRATSRIAGAGSAPALAATLAGGAARAADAGFWSLYERELKGAKYVSHSHVIALRIPVWKGFGPSTFAQARAGADLEGFAKKGATP